VVHSGQVFEESRQYQTLHTFIIIIGIHSFQNRRNQIQKKISEEQLILNRAIQIVPSNFPLIEIESVKYNTCFSPVEWFS
jgi:hypothetical protein